MSRPGNPPWAAWVITSSSVPAHERRPRHSRQRAPARSDRGGKCLGALGRRGVPALSLLPRAAGARGVDAWLVLHERTRQEVEQTFPDDRDRLRFVPDMVLQKIFYRLSLLCRAVSRKPGFGLLNQMLTQWAQRSLIRKLAGGRTAWTARFAVSPRFPSLLFGLPVPRGYRSHERRHGVPAPPSHGEPLAVRLLIAAGRALSGAVNHLLPGKRDAAMLLVANQRTAEALPVAPRGQVVHLPENGVDLQRWQVLSPSLQVSGFFALIGRLVDWKALDIALEAGGRARSLPGCRRRRMLEVATLGSSRAVRQSTTVGSLEVGKKADILVLDTQRIHLVQSVASSHVDHNGQALDIESVMVDGRFVTRDRKILTVDEDWIIAEAEGGTEGVGRGSEDGPIAIPGRPRKR